MLDGVDDELIQKHARHGERAIAQAEPIEPLAAERQTLEQREAWAQYSNSIGRRSQLNNDLDHESPHEDEMDGSASAEEA